MSDEPQEGKHIGAEIHDVLVLGRAQTIEVARPIKLSLTMPVGWQVRGFELALQRLRSAAETQRGNAQDLCIALFELGNWLDTLQARFPALLGTPEVKGFVFVRARTHHKYAAALYTDQDTNEWKWYRTDVLPVPEEEKHRNEAGERVYDERFAEKPLLPTLDAIENAVRVACGADDL